MLYFARWKITVVALVCLTGLTFMMPNFIGEATLESVPDWLPHKHLNLGLDLQGGSHLLLEVDSAAVLKERLESLVESVRGELRTKPRIGYRNLGIQQDAVVVTIRNAKDDEDAYERIRRLATSLSPNPMTGLGGGSDIDVEQRDNSRLVITLTEQAIAARRQSAVTQSIEIVRRRIDELGTREPTIQRQGEDRILVQVPGLQDPQRLKSILGKTAKMVFRLVDLTTTPADARAGRIPPGSELLESDERDGEGNPVQYYVVRKRVMVSGENLVDSQPTFDRGQPVVSFRFDSVGARRFGDATARNVDKPFAIVLDNRVISAPRILSPIMGGSGIITGGFTAQSANDLAVLLRAGALPAPIKIVEERTVGPALGADSISAGKIASIFAFLAVMVFMFLSYGIFGLAANAALLVNMVLLTGALSALQATLTLPGIAGIVLTIGMAVDANVLVFERIKEEVRSGKTPFAAMEAGYRRAIGTIFDANITTFFAAAILFAMGSGPIKGFSVTLGIGIISSVFTAVTVTRLILVIWMRRRRPVALPI